MKIQETKDFYLCGALIVKGFHLIDQTRENGFTVFSFQDSPELQKTISNYYLGKVFVEVSAYGVILRQLKGIMHNSSVSTQNHENNNNGRNSTK